LTHNGKVDLDALSAAGLPGTVPVDPAHLVVAPQTEAEELVAAVWCEVLSLDQIGRTDDFFAIGGHSLLAIKVASRLGAAIGAQVPIRTLFRHRTLAALAQAIEELLVAALADLSDAEAERLLAAAGDAPLRGAM
jgi:acyl carrier protein